ncbi:MAG TPA: putative porin [Chryseosolibacter sp.]|nr:putative porin [Chryseosolibacter sp.]
MYPQSDLLFLRVLVRNFFILTFVLTLCVEQASAQRGQLPEIRRPESQIQQPRNDDRPIGKGSRILDDTTKQVYGPTTSRYYYEDDVFYNRPVIHPIDTVIQNFHRFDYVQRFNYRYQDLGVIGSAIRPVFYQSPEVIGVRSGFDVYDLYWNADRLKYFDTKSPYSKMKLVLGGVGRSFTQATFSRNINSRWNFGINYRGLYIDKQVPIRSGKNDRHTRSNYYDFFTSFYTKDSTYRVFANYRRMFHRAEETGGVRFTNPGDSTFKNYFDENVKVWLSQAESNDLRSNFHFSHQFQLGRALQIYHIFDRYRQKARFQDRYNADRDFFNGAINLRGDTTWDNSKFKTVRNEVGIKGNLLKLFYNGYYAIRHYEMWYSTPTTNTMKIPSEGDESYLGGRIELWLDSIGVINGWTEVNDRGDFRIEGNIVSPWFEASAKQLLYQPGFQDQYYVGTHHSWSRNFAQIQSTELSGKLHYRSKVIQLSPGVKFQRLRNYVYYDSIGFNEQWFSNPYYAPEYINFQLDGFDGQRRVGVLPVQSSGNQIIVSPEIYFSLTFFRHFHLTANGVYTRLFKNDDDAIRVPELLATTQLSYSSIHFNGNLDIQTGVEVHWRSAYLAPGYDPAIRQFYNQDTFEVNEYPLFDAFVNARIKRARIFLKWHNFTQAFTQTGYFATPRYPGQRNVMDFGFDWSFYD